MMADLEVPTTNLNSAEIVPPVVSNSEPFAPDRVDGYFALATFVLGFLFVRWVLMYWQGWGVSLFTVIYVSSVTLYLRHKGRTIPRASWFWLAILVLTGLSYGLWQSYGLQPWREFFLFGVAVYWVLIATDMTLLQGTSDWLPLDGLQGLFVIPLRNFWGQYKGLATLGKKRETRGQAMWPVALGIALALVITAMVVPLLMEADSGGFSAIFDNIGERLRWMQLSSVELQLHLMLTIPIAAYIYGLVVGSAHRRGMPGYKPEAAEKAVDSLRMLPAVTVFIVLGTITGLYLVFILSQIPYFFSAFAGARPEGWQVYSEYARNGFFELCSIAIINLSLLAAANLGIQKQARQKTLLKVLNCVVSLLTLLLIATAWSKMALYISVYGLSVKRLLPCVFMLFLTVVYLGVIALQRRSFSIVRLAAVVGSVLFCLLCLSDPDGFVTRYNANRYLAGTLNNFDVSILYRAGAAGIDGALLVYDKTSDAALRNELDGYIGYWQPMIRGAAGMPKDTLQNALARQMLTRQSR